MNAVIYNVFLVLAISTETEGTLMETPRGLLMGIKMCELECQSLKGCNAIRYDTESLQCTPLTDPKDEIKDSPSVITKTVPIRKGPSHLLLMCSEGNRNVINRHDQPVCVPSEESSVAVKNTSSWLLVVPYNNKVKTAFKVDLITKEIQPWPFIWKRVMAFLPVPREDKYLIAFSGGILSTTMSRPRLNKLLRAQSTYFMCLDQKRGLVFLYLKTRRQHAIGRMKTDGQENRILLNLQDEMPNIMDIDPDEQKVYFMTKKGLIRINYDGKDRNVVIPCDVGIIGVRYHPSKDELYIHHVRTRELMRATRWNNVSFPVVSQQFEMIRSAVLYSDVLYFIGNNLNEISSIRTYEKYPNVVTYPLPKPAVTTGWILNILPEWQRRFR